VNLDVIIELIPELCEGFLKVNLARLNVLEEKVASLCLIKYLENRPVEQFLDKVNSCLRSLLEELLIYTPEFKLYIEHLFVLLLLLMHLTIISNIVNHQVECKWVSIHKNFVIFRLKSVTTREKGLQCAPFELTQGRFSYTKVILTANI
jgi:hypothetical protein